MQEMQEMWFDLWVGKILWRRKWQPAPAFLPGKSPWTEEPGRLQSMGSQRVGHNWSHLHPCTSLHACSKTLQFPPSVSSRDVLAHVHQDALSRLFIALLCIVTHQWKHLGVHQQWNWEVAVQLSIEYYRTVHLKKCCDIQQKEWALQIQCWVKETNHKRVQVLFQVSRTKLCCFGKQT